MRFLLGLLVSLTILFGESLKWNNLTDEQRNNAIAIYEIASKYDLQETMIAIAWQESRLGKISINLEDKASCGIHHVHIKTFLWQNGIKNTITNRNIYCLELIKNVELSTENAIKFFQYAKNKWKGNHKKAIMSYNAGFNLKNNKIAESYYKSVNSYMNEVKPIIEIIKEIKELESMFEQIDYEIAQLDSVEELLF